MIGISHSETLTDIIENETSCGDWEKKGLTWSIEERDVDDIDDIGQAIMDEEIWALVNRLKILNCRSLHIWVLLIIFLKALLWTANFLISHSPKES